MRLTDTQVEWEVITAMLIGPHDYARQRLTQTLSSIHFSDPYHCRLFRAMCDEVEEHGPVNRGDGEGFSVASVLERLKAKSANPDGEWKTLAEFIGDEHYGVRCNQVPGLIQLEKLLHECALTRGIVSIGKELLDYENFNGDPLEFMLSKVKQFEEATRVMDLGDNSLSAVFDELCDESQEQYFTTGVCVFDESQTLYRGCNTIIAASTSVGKSALAIQVAGNAAMRGLRVAYISLEMNNGELLQRAIQSIRGCNKEFAAMDIPENREVVSKLDGRFIALGNSTSWSMRQIKAKLQTLIADGGLDIVVIDHFGLVSSKANTPYDKAGEKSHFARTLSTELDVALIALWQFNRNEDRNSLPTLRSIRDSGVVEEDASSAVLLHASEEDKKLPSQETEVFFAKQRGGDKLRWNAVFSKIVQRFKFDTEIMADQQRVDDFDDFNS